MLTTLRRLALTVAPLALIATATPAHELSDNRATIVLRDESHLTVTLHVTYPDLLFRMLAPAKGFGPFLLEYSTMEPARFLQELLRAQALVERGTRLYGEDGRPLTLTHWAWPDPAAAQALIRERVMQESVDPAGAHGGLVEVRAEAMASHTLRSLSIQFPAGMQRVLVVAYRPTQTWVAPGERSPSLSF